MEHIQHVEKKTRAIRTTISQKKKDIIVARQNNKCANNPFNPASATSRMELNFLNSFIFNRMMSKNRTLTNISAMWE